MHLFSIRPPAHSPPPHHSGGHRTFCLRRASLGWLQDGLVKLPGPPTSWPDQVLASVTPQIRVRPFPPKAPARRCICMRLIPPDSISCLLLFRTISLSLHQSIPFFPSIYIHILHHGCRAHRFPHQAPGPWLGAQHPVSTCFARARRNLRGKPSQANRCLTRHSQAKNADDIVITVAIRTPLTKARKGGFKDSGIEYLTYCLLKELKTRSGIDPALVEDFAFGNVRFCAPR